MGKWVFRFASTKDNFCKQVEGTSLAICVSENHNALQHIIGVIGGIVWVSPTFVDACFQGGLDLIGVFARSTSWGIIVLGGVSISMALVSFLGVVGSFGKVSSWEADGLLEGSSMTGGG